MLAAGASLVLAVAVAGCGGSDDLDGAALSNEIEESLKKQNKVRKAEVKCPAKIEPKARATFSCPFVTDRASGNIRVVQQDAEGSVRWQVEPKSVRPL